MGLIYLVFSFLSPTWRRKEFNRIRKAYCQPVILGISKHLRDSPKVRYNSLLTIL